MRYLGLVLAAGIPLGVYIALTGDSPYWLDSPEFVGSAFALQPAHPPGHPLYVLLGRAILLLPAGSAAFRMNLLGGLCAAGALAVAQDMGVRILRHGLRVTGPTAVLVPTAMCVLVGISPGWLHQAVHAEVYTLQVLLLSLVLWCWVRALLDLRERNRFLVLGMLVLGLSLANHHLTGFLLLPAIIAAVTASALQQKLERPGRLVLACALVASIACVTYALIPIRGVVAPSMLLGRVETASDFFWLVSAKVYQKSIGSGWAQGQDMEGVVFLVAEQVGIALGILSLAGLYLGARIRETRPVGVLVAVALLTSLGGRMMLQFDRTNPDIMGYLLVVLVLLVAAASVVAGGLSNLARGRRWLQVAAILAVAALPSWEVWLRAPGVLERIEQGDPVGRAQLQLRELGVARVAPGSVAVTTLYATSFLTWYGRVVEGERPDVRHVPLPFVGYRGEAAVLVNTWEELAPLVRGFLVSGSLPAPQMASLAQERPVYVEPDPFLENNHIQYLEPGGLFMAFRPEPVARRDVMAAADRSSDRVDRMLETHELLWSEPQTRRYVLWWLYNRSLVLARRGYSAGARRAALQALAVVPGIPELQRLVRHLDEKPGAVEDIAPFLP